MTAEQILDMLMTQTFADFYKGDLDSFITGEEDAMSKEEIIREIQEMMPRGFASERERMRAEIIKELREKVDGVVDMMFARI